MLAAKVVINLAEQLHDLQVRIGVLEKDLVAMERDVRYGSGTDISRFGFYVCFTPNNGHRG